MFLYRYTTADPQPFWQGFSAWGGDRGGEPDAGKSARVVPPAISDSEGAAEEAVAGFGIVADAGRAAPLLLPVVARVRPVIAALPRIDSDQPEAEPVREPSAAQSQFSVTDLAEETAAPGVVPEGAIRVHFDFDSSALDEDSRRSLELAAYLMERAGPAARARISGYADPFGNGDYNLSLSRRRAETVANYMERLGVSPRRMEVRGLGSDGGEPHAAGVDAQRLVRVEIIPAASR